jgi:hypothetical protein
MASGQQTTAAVETPETPREVPREVAPAAAKTEWATPWWEEHAVAAAAD